MELIDTHCHLDVEAFAADRDAVITRAQSAGVCQFVVPGIHRDEWMQLRTLRVEHTAVYPAFGLHPVYLDIHTEAHVAELYEWIATERPIAVGEIGLDFAIKSLDPRRQQHLFEQQLDLAFDALLPVLLHVRKAHDQVLHALRNKRLVGGICHAFNGSLQQAHQYLDLGFKLGFGGMLTYERSTKLRQLAKNLPTDALVLETDAPDLTVASHRFERNSPEYLPEVLAALAQIRGQPAAELADVTTTNARAVLRLPGPEGSKQRD